MIPRKAGGEKTGADDRQRKLEVKRDRKVMFESEVMVRDEVEEVRKDFGREIAVLKREMAELKSEMEECKEMRGIIRGITK